MSIITQSDTSRKRIAAIGMYDGVHTGHKFLFNYLRSEAANRSLTPAVITFSCHPLSVVRPLETPKLLTPLDERLRLIEIEGIDDIILLTFNDKIRYKSAREFLSMLHKSYGIDALVLGFNNRFGHDRPKSLDDYRQIGKEVGVDVISAPEYRENGMSVSSSSIRRMLLNGKPEEALEALGYAYSLRGIVVDGNKLGRKLGFPTANIKIENEDILIPKPGVYATAVTTPDGKKRKAMANIGYRPTVSNEEPKADNLSIEVHILNFTGYLYHEELTVEFLKYLRSERRFESAEKLREQLEKDADETAKLQI